MMALVIFKLLVLYAGILVAIGTALYFIIKNAVKKALIEAHIEIRKREEKVQNSEDGSQ